MKLYKTNAGPVVEADARYYALPQADWDDLVNRDALRAVLADAARTSGRLLDESAFRQRTVLPPVGTQEVWAAGVTYLRSKVARMEDSKYVRGWYEEKVVEGQRIKERLYEITGAGERALNEAVRFYEERSFGLKGGLANG